MTENLFANESWSWFREVEFPSDSDCGRDLLEEILQNLSTAGWSDKHVFGIHLSMEEALVNAIKHGNKYNADKNVRVKVGISPALFRAEIEDEGEGFAPEKLPDPTSPEFIDRPNGRGVMLMRNFMSKVEYNNRGNTVFMEKTP